jgi:hypothetical protein
MRRKHGRDRTFVGYASEIDILTGTDARAHAEGREKRESR